MVVGLFDDYMIIQLSNLPICSLTLKLKDVEVSRGKEKSRRVVKSKLFPIGGSILLLL
jgi:hypothetical protein